MTTQSLAAAVAVAFLTFPTTAVAKRPVEHPGKGHGVAPGKQLPAPALEQPIKQILAPVPAPPVAPVAPVVDAPVPAEDDAPATALFDEVVEVPVVGPEDSLADKTEAYGDFCTAASKKKAKGVRTTPFAACVTALARLAVGDAATPAAACKGVSRKKVKGVKGTPYSVCVKAAAKLQEELEEEEEEEPTPVDEPDLPADEPAVPIDEPVLTEQ